MKRLIIFLILNLTSILLFSQIFSISAYPGYGDCKDHHGITNIKANFYEDASIKLDGVPNETVWSDFKNQEGFLQIPTAPIDGPPGNDNITINMLLIYNNEYIFIYCEWLDSSTKPFGLLVYDGIYFCWNINTPNFTSYYPSNEIMNTQHMGGGHIDSWSTSFYDGDNHANQSSFLGGDKYIDDDGFGGEVGSDIQVGFSYIVGYSYSLEIKRKFLTDDQYKDVQFYEGKSYLFNIGVMNDSEGIDHEISWVHSLQFINDDEDNDSKKIEPQFNIGFFIIIIIIPIISIITLIIYYKSKVIKN